jgi:hypothetical protein
VLVATRQNAFPGVVCLALISCSNLLPGCAAPQTTALTADDMQVTAVELRQKLLDSVFMRDRGPDSPPIVVAIQKPHNLSRDIIPESEQWMLMHRVRQAAPISELRTLKGITFVIPASQVSSGIDSGAFSQGAMENRKPTHVMTATFRSGTRQVKHDRTDQYQVELEIIELSSGAPVFSDVFEFKRAASGSALD